jgi:hypothetical protein
MIARPTVLSSYLRDTTVAGNGPFPNRLCCTLGSAVPGIDAPEHPGRYLLHICGWLKRSKSAAGFCRG